jgi:hypothetical protein
MKAQSLQMTKPSKLYYNFNSLMSNSLQNKNKGEQKLAKKQAL